MRALALVLAVAPLVGAACTPRTDERAPSPEPPVQSQPPGASAKIGAAQVGEVSPVPAFRAIGEGWRLQAEGTEGLRLSARLQRDGGGERNATLLYDPRRANAAPRTHVLSGTLYGEAGGADLAITVTLVRVTCDNREGEHAWRAEVVVAGGETLRGCADVAT